MADQARIGPPGEHAGSRSGRRMERIWVMKPPRWMMRLGCVLLAGVLVALVGCGVLSARKTDYAAALKTADGQSIFVEDVRAILDDQTLSDNDKGFALRDLGIEEDDLILALLTLTAAEPAG